ncbi:acyl-CoA synthetase [Mycobacterium persicum]|uniref:3-oxocholest-4-en-26-oate--CoA ligase n=1 Tax=Mycobacterium persicum TaxID=1487726 RepID=A0A8E2LRR5_9MYCO|nr:acyl-CoA synthetase [Mycobacterium persicum]KZS77934.1 acyl-CoA synthetase [Mycobacterium persicum]ORB58223.1 acyl-CoA synthetase [Mycobacterium persicum]ORB97305.1 acyl-CoA synthetase [Mycobacterium persicum]ORC03951.1 acyl-CoA synthetase [Mycobacterium persicum]ORC09440.1 acyl-CoA synthetase [Mycobacterium persicum]
MEFNIAQVFSAVAAANPDRDCIVFGDRRFTYAQTDERARRFARALHRWGLGVRRERSELAPYESGQSHLGLYLANGNEFLEAMIGAYQARVAPFNVNYRYVADELVYLLGNAAADAVMYHARFGPTLAEALERYDHLPRLIHVDDHSGNDPLPGAVRYEELLASISGTSEEPLDVTPSPDDLYVLYTGGTTGMPKAVLWRQHDIYMNAMGGRAFGTGELATSLQEIVERSRPDGPGSMTAAPLMHGAAQWAAFINLCGGRTFVMAPTTTHFDPAEVWALASREQVVSLSIVGDAFGRPLIDELESGDYDLSGLLILVTGGAALSAPIKQRFVELLPQLAILDAGGSSESGSQMGQVSTRLQGASGRFAPNPGAVVVSEDMTRILSPGDDEIGWLAQQGLIPLGYLGDPEKTARTFPVIEGIRHSVPGDRARWAADGGIELLGRDSVTINSGGEKIFAEEVEAAIAEHPAVYDVVVTGRPSVRWGSEVVAIVQLAQGRDADPDSIIAEAARHIARYKLPKDIVFCSRVQRSPSGKADYRWAKDQVTQKL